MDPVFLEGFNDKKSMGFISDYFVYSAMTPVKDETSE